jgi:hypothetical protein
VTHYNYRSLAAETTVPAGRRPYSSLQGSVRYNYKDSQAPTGGPRGSFRAEYPILPRLLSTAFVAVAQTFQSCRKCFLKLGSIGLSTNVCVIHAASRAGSVTRWLPQIAYRRLIIRLMAYVKDGPGGPLLLICQISWL